MIDMKTTQSPGTHSTNAHSENTQVYCFEHEPDAEQTLTVSIARAIAAVTGTEPGSLRPRLYDVLDTEALEQLIRRSREAGSQVKVSFEIADLFITINGNSRILIQMPSTS